MRKTVSRNINKLWFFILYVCFKRIKAFENFGQSLMILSLYQVFILKMPKRLGTLILFNYFVYVGFLLKNVFEADF